MMKRPDFAVPVGLCVGLAAIAGCAMVEGIRLGFLWQPTAALVVFGGTLGAVVVRRGLPGLSHAARAAWASCFKEDDDTFAAAQARLAWIARAARREGAKVLENHAEASRDPLVAQALQLASQYADAELVRARLARILDYEDERGLSDVTTLEAAGGYAPTFGILGAVLGLIQVLRAVAEPHALGTGIATAFVATIYGVGVANLLFFPLASRLRERHRARMKKREALADALLALAAHESPTAIALRLADESALAARTA
jgi:chemotaxis protein MotA